MTSVSIVYKYTVCRYLATGNRFISLHYEYLLGATAVREIVRDTCDAIWECLKLACFSARDKNDWIRTAKEFYEWTFGKLLESNKLNIPDTRVLPSYAERLSMPFVFVGDEAFALSEHVLRSFNDKR